jgi:molecular chaperone GrpE (heat shock protein)
MSKELNEKIDAARAKLIATANQTVGMGNYKQIKRAFEEVLLDITNVVDDLNEAIDQGEK